jgi:hypothetical protein
MYMSKRDRVQVVFHFPVPDTTNFAGVNYRTALVEYLTRDGATITSAYPGIDAGELTQLQAGEVYETVDTVVFDGKLSNTEKRDLIDATWTAKNSVFLAKFQEGLTFWGYDRDVPV